MRLTQARLVELKARLAADFERAGVPYGSCQCGCGGLTPISSRSHARYGHVRDEPVHFIFGHHTRKSPVEYVEEDRGHDTPCWIWQLAIVGAGYGQWQGEYAHRVYYRQAKGPIPDGLELDHLCRVRACVNPAHLEPVTHGENVRRGWPHRRLAAA